MSFDALGLLPALLRRIGRRGATLLFFALVDLALALSLLDPLPLTKQQPATVFIDSIAPLQVWGLLWLVAGITCFIGAFLKSDQWAFTLAVGIKVLWGLTYLLMQLIVHIERAWLGATVWLCMAVFVYIISTWPEPSQTVTPSESPRQVQR